jgi:type IV pilus assembly protein PilF
MMLLGPRSACWRFLAACMLPALLCAALAGCASNSGGSKQTPARGDTRDLQTASDQSSADRRAHVRLELASAYFGRGQSETALDELKQALAADPNLGDAYNLRGLVYASLGEARLAEESFGRALQINPRDADAMHNFGWFLCQQGRYSDADAQFAQAMAQPQYRDITRTLLVQGVCQSRAGDLATAEKTLLRSYEGDPSNGSTAANLADVLYRRGDFERARFYIRRVNTQPELSNAQTLWLAARIEHRAGNMKGAEDFGRQLRSRFPQAPEALAFERGRYDD